MSSRECAYASPAEADHLSAPRASSHDLSPSPASDQTPAAAAVSNVNPWTAVALSGPSISDGSAGGPPTDENPDGVLNLAHMELFIHAMLEKDLMALGRVDIELEPFTMAIALETARDAPYLLHAMLGFSARHLAFLNPTRSASYLHQAVALQTRAVSLFNASWTEVNESNCVAILLFSTTVGHQILTDTLARREPGGLDNFLHGYVQCIKVHRGVHTIAVTAQQLLMESRIWPILAWSAELTSRSPSGRHCQGITRLVDEAVGMAESEKVACRDAINYLQVGLDALFSENESTSRRYQMISSWTLLVSPEFADLLEAKRPEVLVILAHYALLLYHGRHIWQVGDSGTYVFGLISEYLGPDWAEWLEYPRAQMVQ